MIYDSTVDYANPKHHVTPLIELEKLSGMTQGKARVFAKLAPLGNIKRIPAAYMCDKAKRDGRLAKTHTVIEASSGGMATALGLESYRAGKHFIACIRNDTAQGQKWALGMLGVQVVLENDLPKGTTLIEYARDEGKKPGFLNFCQYETADNAVAYEVLLAPQIYDQLRERNLEEKPLVFVCGVGTGGTLLGCARGLKMRHPDVRAIGAILAPEERVPGVRDPKRLVEVKTGWKDIIWGDPIQITRYQAYLRSLELVKMDVDGGPSSGLALAAVIEYLKLHESRKGVVIVFICPDSFRIYADKYETILDGPEFARRSPFGL